MAAAVTPVHRLAFGKRLRQLDLDRVDARDVMHDHAECPPVFGHAGVPFLVGQADRESDQGASALLETIGERLGELAGNTDWGFGRS